jgi:outer membrane immunogenic protein
MYKYVATTAVLGLSLGFGAVAHAADLAPIGPGPAPVYTKAPPPLWSWTGFYVGGNVGGAWGTSSATNPFFGFQTTGDYPTSGIIAGGQAGYNWQFSSWVLGLETDMDWSDVKGTTSNGICSGVVCTTSDSWLGTTRARFGYAVDHLLVYGTGGVAYGDVKFDVSPAAPFGANAATTRTGWTAGAGLEYAFTRNWSAKLEYLYVDLGTADLACTPGCGTGAHPFNENIVRGGVNFHF